MKIKILPVIICLACILCKVFPSFAQTSWTGTTDTNWGIAGNWSTNAVPTAATDVIIGDRSLSNQPTISATANCKSLTVGGTGTATLTLSSSTLTVANYVTINSNGTLSQGSNTLTLSGNWNNGGSYTATSVNSTVIFNGALDTLGGTVPTTFRKLTINAGKIVTLTSNVTCTGTSSLLTISGTLNPNESPTTYLVTSDNLTVSSTGTLKVNASLFASNYIVTILSLSTGSIVEYSATTTNQTVSSSYAYSTLNISGAGRIKSLSADLLPLKSSALGVGNINVISGIFDLSTFLANRGTSSGGGTLKVFDGAFLKIGGTKTFPSNYIANTLLGASTVEYYGANQAIFSITYGNLVLSSSGGPAVKTLPATAFIVAGSLTSTLGLGTSVSYAAASNISVIGSINIGNSTTFDGATFSHSVAGDWNNNGFFTSGTSTITLNGADSKISGNLVQNFYNLTVSGSVDLLNSGTIELQNLVISPGFSLILDHAILQIAGTVNGSGNFNAGNGTIEMNGAAAQTIPANTFMGNTVDNLIISNSSTGGVILDGAIDVYGSLTYSDTGMKLTTNDSLTIKSTALNTAWIGNMTGDTIIGKVTVERYIAAHKAWQFLSIPTNTLQTIKETWQEGATNIDSDLVKGYGTQITSNLGTWSAGGFDLHSTGPSMKRYNSATNTWVGIANTNTDSIKAIDGYMVFIRGDRTANAFNSPSSETVMRTKGSLYSGDQDTILVSANKFASIGNPFASALDMRNITKSGLKDFFYVWDPQLGGSKGLGAYQIFSNNGVGDYVITPGDGSYGGSGTVSNYIQSGLAFLIQADSLGGSLIFKETAKTDGSGQVSAVAGLPQPQLRTSLYGVNADNSTYMIDGVLSNYDDSYNNNVDGMDAIKSTNTSENLSIKTANTLLVIERRHSIAEKDTIFLNLANTKVQQYRFQFTAAQLDLPGQIGFLEDNYTHTSTPLNLNGSTIADFNIVNIPGSYATNRFRIVFTPALVLPLSFTSVKAYQKNKDIAVEWKVENEINIRQYEIEKSNNGTQFTNLSVTAATGNGGHSAIYQVTDARPVEGYNYYRIKRVDLNGRTEYTNVVKVLMGKGKQEITIYPNPVIDGVISIQLNNMPEGNYAVKLINNLGQKVLDKIIQHTEGSSTELITVDKSMPHGLYQLQIIKPDNEMITNKLMH